MQRTRFLTVGGNLLGLALIINTLADKRKGGNSLVGDVRKCHNPPG